MQRPIEYRAWDKRYKRIFAVESINWFYREVNIITHDDEKTPSGETIISTEVRSFEDVELLEYTGLLDRHGIKIFEGDVVEQLQSWSETVRRKKVIEWKTVKTSTGFNIVSGEHIRVI